MKSLQAHSSPSIPRLDETSDIKSEGEDDDDVFVASTTGASNVIGRSQIASMGGHTESLTALESDDEPSSPKKVRKNSYYF